MQVDNSSIFVVIPVFNDWESCALLLKEIKRHASDSFYARLRFCWVNDGSHMAAPHSLLRKDRGDLHIELTRNVGHQKAIALGIAAVAAKFPGSPIMVMDSDGEDRPEDMEKLANSSFENDCIVFARRTKRHEGLVFKFFYEIYKLVFLTLTGKKIAFGNYSFIPGRLSTRVAHVSEIWNHFSGGILKSRIPYTSIPLERGKRLAGSSKMNFTSLVLHGLSAVAIHADTMAVRLVLFCLGLAAFSLWLSSLHHLHPQAGPLPSLQVLLPSSCSLFWFRFCFCLLC